MPVSSSASGIKAGTVAHFGASTAPAGWIKANGAAISRTTYATLFLAIGTTYGVGDGSTTFNLPDLRGEFLRGFDDGRGVDSGRAIGSAQASQVVSHTHAITTGGSFNATGGRGYGQANDSVSSMNTGAYGGGETRPRNVALLACIKY